MDEQSRRVVDVSTLAYDLNAIMDFILQDKTKDKKTEIKEIYGKDENGNLILQNKELIETKSEESGGIASMRYDLVRHLIDKADSIIMNDFDMEDIEDEALEASSPIMSTLGDTFAINTLLKEGMLVNMNFNEVDKEDE